MKEQYYVTVRDEDINSYSYSVCDSLDEVKSNIEQVLENDTDVEDNDFKIYKLTSLKVETSRTIRIIEEK